MLEQIEGSQAVARAVGLSRPEVICAYPISPQTHIVEALSVAVKSGALERCEFVNVESEFAALSVAIGASAAGARAYTATASQGLLFMIEAVYNAAGLGLPIVMTLANRAIGAPINIWNDHSDAMAVRDAGWIQLFAETNQDAADLHIYAFRLAEQLSVPVMVNMDGFILTHATERVDLPTQEQVDAFLPPYAPSTYLDPADPVSIGAMVGPEAFTEVRYLASLRQHQALSAIEQIDEEFSGVFGRRPCGFFSLYRAEDAEIIAVAMGSAVGTLKDAVDDLREQGLRVGALGLRTFRPFPADALRSALSGARRVIVFERAHSPGFGGQLSADIAATLRSAEPEVHSVVSGLGGRPVTRRSVASTIEAAAKGELGMETFLDLDESLLKQQVAELGTARRSSAPGGSAAQIIETSGPQGAR
ncbi:MAG: pyruvate ferredoxin oxidoreductase [Actinomycetota bacterium]|nr:pyruvate ferredoxin oxidoreductase [Actinomycetota bacterium]